MHTSKMLKFQLSSGMANSHDVIAMVSTPPARTSRKGLESIDSSPFALLKIVKNLTDVLKICRKCVRFGRKRQTHTLNTTPHVRICRNRHAGCVLVSLCVRITRNGHMGGKDLGLHISESGETDTRNGTSIPFAGAIASTSL